MKKILIILLAISLFTTIVFAETYHPRNVVTKTASYTGTLTDDEVDFNCSAGNVTFTLPAISTLGTWGVKSYMVKKIDAGRDFITIAANSADSIEGTAAGKVYVIAPGDYVILTSDRGRKVWKISYYSPYTFESPTTGKFVINATAKIMNTLDWTGGSDGMIPIYNAGDGFRPKTLSGAATISNTGALTLADGIVTAAKIDNSDSDAQVIIGQGAAAPAWKTLSGAATISNAGALTLADGIVTAAKIDNSDSDAQVLIGQGAAAPAWKTMSNHGALTNAGVFTLNTNTLTVILHNGIANGVGTLSPGSVLFGCFANSAFHNGYFINACAITSTDATSRTVTIGVTNDYNTDTDHGQMEATVVSLDTL